MAGSHDQGESAEGLAAKAAALPGVAEVLEAYLQARKTLDQANPYLHTRSKRTVVVYRSSDSSS